MNIAVLMTCHNRRETTLRCLDALACAAQQVKVEVFLVDDGSTDGTGEAVKDFFTHHSTPTPNAYTFSLHLIRGSGDLFWARGMALAWREALKDSSFSHYLWLNDDVELFPDALVTLLEDSSAALRLHLDFTPATPPVLVGSCCDRSGQSTYGATDERDVRLQPNGGPQLARGWFNGNVVLIPREVSERVGLISEAYSHARADYDYAERLKRAGIPFCATSRFVGICANDWVDKMNGKGLGARIASLWRPGYSNLHDLWLIRSRYHGTWHALLSCLHMCFIVLRRVK